RLRPGVRASCGEDLRVGGGAQFVQGGGKRIFGDQAIDFRDVQRGVGTDTGDLRGVGQKQAAAGGRGGGALDRGLTGVGVAHDAVLRDPGAAEYGAVDVQVLQPVEDAGPLGAAVVAVVLPTEHHELDLGRGGEQVDDLEGAGDHGEVEVH